MTDTPNQTAALFAHMDEDRAPEPLDAHARAVASLARRLADTFDAGDLGYAAGLLHDLGKAKPAFQRKLFGEKNNEPHSAEGARYAVEHYAGQLPPPYQAPLGRLLAFIIAGHHAGLANGADYGAGTRPLDDRLATAEHIKPWFPPAELPPLSKPPRPLMATGLSPFGVTFFTRMLFSALVDADFIETERWFNEPDPDATARGSTVTLPELKQRLDAHIAANFEAGAATSVLARLRAEVLADCRAGADLPPGLFSLTVPTGGGKTLSSLAFALDHAIQNDLDRVIYVIPFTSIVEQTAAVFRKALQNDDAILEHHSAFDAEKLGRDKEPENDFNAERLRLAAQNWDRPIVVTTAVQFFESLFANRTSRCRKLHNIARSVVVLDEAQTLPVKLLRPCLAALDTLTRGYKTSIVLCTATQPALTETAGLKAPERLRNVREIIPDGRRLFERLKRVKATRAGVMSDADLVTALGDSDQGLIILNNRRHARDLFTAMQAAGLNGARHLSTAMTARHRQQALDAIRHDLDPRNARPVRLVSTSLIEAGVDISFKTVWRAWTGLDQIVQAAGRCNRNGELGPEGGQLTIFEPEPGDGRGIPRELKPNIETAMRVVPDHADPLSEAAVAHYFRELMWVTQDDNRFKQLDAAQVGEDAPITGIMKAIALKASGLNFPFADIAHAFRMIEDTMVPVIIPRAVFAIDGAPDQAFLDSIPHRPSLGGVARALQPHIVQIPRKARRAMIDASAAYSIAPDTLDDQFVVLRNAALYTPERGLDWDDPTFRSAESLVL